MIGNHYSSDFSIDHFIKFVGFDNFGKSFVKVLEPFASQ